MDDDNPAGETGCVYFHQAGNDLVITQALSCLGKRIRCLASGHDALFALCDEETVVVCGNNDNSFPGFAQTAHGSRHSIAVSSAGELYAWGSNDNGLLGTGPATTESTAPKQLSTKIRAEKVVASSTHSAVIDGDGGLFVWGPNFQGQLALHDTEKVAELESGRQIVMLPRFVPFSSRNKVTSVGCGDGFTVVATRQGAVWGWGTSDCGQVGVQRKSRVLLPRLILECDIEDKSPIHSVACGWAHALCMSSSGAVFSWGLNSHGQLGRQTSGNCSWQPTQLDMEPSTALYASGCMSAVITKQRKLLTWGLNEGCLLLHESGRTITQPTLVDAFSKVEVADLCFSKLGTTVLVRSRVYTINPTLAPWNQTAAVELLGGGLYTDENTVVRFTYEMAQRPGRAALATFEDGGDFVGRLVCAPPMLTQPGAYKVEVAMDGLTFLSAGWIQFYQPVQLVSCVPAVVDLATEPDNSVVNLVFQCDQAIDLSLDDNEIKVKLRTDDGREVILDALRVGGKRTGSRHSQRRSGTEDSLDMDAAEDDDSNHSGKHRRRKSTTASTSDSAARQTPTKLQCTWDLESTDTQLPFVAQMCLSMNAGVDWSAAARQRVVLHSAQFDPKPAIWCSLGSSQAVEVTGTGFMSPGLTAHLRWEQQTRKGSHDDASTTKAQNDNDANAAPEDYEVPVQVLSPTSLVVIFDPVNIRVPEGSNEAFRANVEFSVGSNVLERPELPLQLVFYQELELETSATTVCANGGNVVHIDFPPLQFACETMVVQAHIEALGWEELVPAEVAEQPGNDAEQPEEVKDAAEDGEPTLALPRYQVRCTLPALPEDCSTLAEEASMLQLRLMPNGSTPTESALQLRIYALPTIQQVNPATAKAGATITVTLDNVVECENATVRLRSADDKSVTVPATTNAAENNLTFVVPGADVLSSVATKGKPLFVDVSLDGQIYATSLDSKLTVK